ncbi:antitoxin VapB family protein [Haloplanus sp. GCM10025708]|uniref:DUF7557 family protein n=1 Tax=Haloferacaceae TaxID=1644056 RepID=UPI00361E62BE
MSKSVRISESLHERIRAHKREGETMEDTIRRLIGGPDPGEVAGILSPETADAIEEGLEEKRREDVDSKEELRELFE